MSAGFRTPHPLIVGLAGLHDPASAGYKAPFPFILGLMGSSFVPPAGGGKRKRAARAIQPIWDKERERQLLEATHVDIPAHPVGEEKSTPFSRTPESGLISPRAPPSASTSLLEEALGVGPFPLGAEAALRDVDRGAGDADSFITGRAAALDEDTGHALVLRAIESTTRAEDTDTGLVSAVREIDGHGLVHDLDRGESSVALPIMGWVMSSDDDDAPEITGDVSDDDIILTFLEGGA